MKIGSSLASHPHHLAMQHCENASCYILQLRLGGSRETGLRGTLGICRFMQCLTRDDEFHHSRLRIANRRRIGKVQTRRSEFLQGRKTPPTRSARRQRQTASHASQASAVVVRNAWTGRCFFSSNDSARQAHLFPPSASLPTLPQPTRSLVSSPAGVGKLHRTLKRAGPARRAGGGDNIEIISADGGLSTDKNLSPPTSYLSARRHRMGLSMGGPWGSR